jgi:trans-aconitate 2-methyltransferase
VSDTWNPTFYERFAAQRRLPFDDLLALVVPVPGGRVVDLGCGTGELTAELHRHTRAAATLGIDSSPAMLQRSAELQVEGLSFRHDDLAAVEPDGSWDVVFANASLQWVPQHRSLFPRLRDCLARAGQLAVQMPANFDHPTHILADRIGRELGMPTLADFEGVLSLPDYAVLLHELGFTTQRVREEVYLHPLRCTADLLEWVAGSLLTRYRRDLGEEKFATFHQRYSRELLAELGDPQGQRPYAFPFKRILLHARLPA